MVRLLSKSVSIKTLGTKRASQVRNNFINAANEMMPERLVLCTTGSQFTFGI